MFLTVFNTGGRYDPATDSWRPTSTQNAPSARSGPTAVWTGSEMIVWGGGLPRPTPAAAIAPRGSSSRRLFSRRLYQALLGERLK